MIYINILLFLIYNNLNLLFKRKVLKINKKSLDYSTKNLFKKYVLK